MMKRLPLILSLMALPGAAFASPVWSSNFEAGDLSEWTKSQMVAPDRMQIVTDPVKEGARALKVVVHQGDDPINSHNDRAELIQMTNEPEGSEYWYHWNVMFAPDYPSSPKWQLFTQWHQNGLNGSPPVELYVVGEEIRLRTGGNEGPVVWTTPLVRGQWLDFVFHVKWSSDPGVGFVEVFYNGEPALPRTPAATQLPGDVNYLKMGLYRAREIAETGVVYFDDIRMGTEMADVMPTAVAGGPPAQDPGAGSALTSGGSTGAPTTGNPVPGGDLASGGAGCGGSTTGASTLPVGLAIGVLASLAAFRRRRAAVSVPARRTTRHRAG